MNDSLVSSFIAATGLADRLDVLSNLPSGLDGEQYSALIGIVTAIVGNVVVSFALNLQRYAHIRIEREANQQGRGAHRDRSQADHDTSISSHLTEGPRTVKRWVGSSDFTNSRRASRRYSNGEGVALLGERHRDSGDIRNRDGEDDDDNDDDDDDDDDEGGPKPSKNYLRSPIWWLGFTLMIVGEAGNFLAYGFAPASIVSPLGVVAILSNCIIAPCLLKERFRKQDFWGVLIAVGGVVTVVLSANTSETKMGPDQIWEAISRWEFELYLGITAGLMLILSWASSRYGERSVFIDLGLVALFGGYTALSTKGVASLVSGTLWQTLSFPITYLLGLVLVASALLQLRYLNRALQRFDSTQVLPIQFVLFTISVIVGSTILYRDFESATIAQVGKFVGGCLLTFLGVYLITSGRGHDEDTKQPEDDSEAERAIVLAGEDRVDSMKPAGIPRARPAAFVTPNATQSDSNLQCPRDTGLTNDGYGSLPASESDLALAKQVAHVEATPESTSPPTQWHTPAGPVTPRPSLPHHSTASSALSRASQSDPRGPMSRADSRGSTHSASLMRSRRSMTSMLPGPISSTLSPSFSGLVIDARRRGPDSPTQARQKRFQSLRKTMSQRAEGTGAGEWPHDPSDSAVTADPATTADATDGEQRTGASPSTPKGQRSHSLSDVLNPFLRR